ncbi:diguanylate cyclase (GGDEF) domain [Mycoplasma sp. CAG:776]|nr:diguanylate cyclase (GGDEF) domain [Mycoplasma sp. CAG:776]
MEKVELLVNNNVDVKGSLEFWGDMDSYNENLLEFKNSLEEKINSLEYYKNSKDCANYAIIAHSMKSEAKYLGFKNEAEIFLSHELKGKENDINFIETNFDNLKQVTKKIIEILNKYFENSSKKIILIADDSNIILNFLEENLNNYNIIKAKNGNDAIEAIKNNNLYAILLDLNMPDLNGFDVLEFLKEHNLINKIPIVVITGDDTKETIKKAFSYQILDILNKPFTEENIKHILNSINNFYEKDKI